MNKKQGNASCIFSTYVEMNRTVQTIQFFEFYFLYVCGDEPFLSNALYLTILFSLRMWR